MTNNTLDYLSRDATITFDADAMTFRGEIETAGGYVQFSASDIKSLRQEYTEAISKATVQDELYNRITREVVSTSEKIASGEARIQFAINETDEHIGATIRMMLTLADGASFIVHERRA